MKKTRCSRQAAGAGAVLLAAALAAALGLRLLTCFDNKYTAKAQIAQDGVTVIPEDGVRYLVDGWELYPDALLSPADFAAGKVPPRYAVWAKLISSCNVPISRTSWSRCASSAATSAAAAEYPAFSH